MMRCYQGQVAQVRTVGGTAAAGNFWHPALAAGPDRRDRARLRRLLSKGNYDVSADVRFWAGRRTGDHDPPHRHLAPSSRPARRSVYDAEGRLWIAYEEGPEQWGKDYGALDAGNGNPLYNERSVRVVCLDTDGKLMQARRRAADVDGTTRRVLPFEAVKTNQYERATRYAYPKIGIDGKGRVWLTYRQNFGTPLHARIPAPTG